MTTENFHYIACNEVKMDWQHFEKYQLSKVGVCGGVIRLTGGRGVLGWASFGWA